MILGVILLVRVNKDIGVTYPFLVRGVVRKHLTTINDGSIGLMYGPFLVTTP